MNILVVDDDHDVCVLLSRFLERHGYTVFSAGDALQALDVLERHTVGLILSDYQMPHMDGIRFTEALKQDPRTKNIPVILVTGHSAPDFTDRSLRSGIALTLQKPLDLDRLLTLVRFAE